MDINKIRKELIVIADHLDRRGHSDLADMIDKKILASLVSYGESWKNSVKRAIDEQNYEEVEVEIPEDERLMLEDVLKSLQESLQ